MQCAKHGNYACLVIYLLDGSVNNEDSMAMCRKTAVFPLLADGDISAGRRNYYQLLQELQQLTQAATVAKVATVQAESTRSAAGRAGLTPSFAPSAPETPESRACWV